MKRRALISATAVMLVALMCLVTASYAWFTADGAATVESFDVKVQGADAAVELSANGTMFTPTLKIEDFTKAGQTIPASLDAVSTPDGVNFFASDYNGGVWTGSEDAAGKYIKLDFYARAPKAGTADLKFTFNYNGLTPTHMDYFKGAVKVGVSVNGGAFTLYDITTDPAAADYYQPMQKNTAKCEKFQGHFVPTSDTPVGSFADTRAQVALPETINVPIAADDTNADDGDSTAITVIVWLEGMDMDCVGNFDQIAKVGLGMSFSNYQEA